MVLLKKITTSILCISIFMTLFVRSAIASEPVTIYTSHFPHVVTEDPHQPGIAYEIVQELFKLVQKDFKLIVLPWARAQYMAKQTPHALIFPLSRTTTREQNYVWRVNIFNNQTHFITFNNIKLTVETAREKHIGVQLKSSWDNWLTEHGFERVHRVPGEGRELIKLLRNNRIDAWYTDTIIAGSVLNQQEDQNIAYSEPIQTFKTFLATNSAAPYPHLEELKVAMDQLRSSGKIDEIFKKYNIPPNY
ncbi:substrate-binding periplasmic protein [Sneathiella sp.]|uniref:substrate-binding periplasmic protein n=1 Tax=Sneathiella sp. TaxID=1964365 RepID=UPI0039E4D2CE